MDNVILKDAKKQDLIDTYAKSRDPKDAALMMETLQGELTESVLDAAMEKAKAESEK